MRRARSSRISGNALTTRRGSLVVVFPTQIPNMVAQISRSLSRLSMIRNLSLVLAALLALAATSLAQETPTYIAKTAGTAAIEIDILKYQLKPLTVDQVKVEADAWQANLTQVNQDISDRLVLANKLDNEPTAAERKLQNGILQRLDVTLRALKNRGGDATAYEQYIAASTATGISFAFIKDWIMSPDGGIQFALNVLKFLLTLLAFKIIARIIASIVRKAVSRMKGASDLLRDFVVNVASRVTFFLGLIFALSALGIDVTPFVAALGAAGFVLGFALQGTLSNFASGLMILVYRPYDIGEVITAAGTTGKVDAMTLVSTTLRLPDNQTVIIPNNSIWGGVITNISGQATRRVDMKFGCGYGDDLQKTQALLEDIVSKHAKVHAEPAPVIKVHELADSSVNFVVRPWANTADYWDVFWDVTRAVKDRFDAEGLNIPFPQQEVHMHQIKD
ncbi:MAG: small conductance mechanosensitive channel [Planctomycetota bacterium]|jgi:small conductance mechanosensitive channel